MVRVVAISASLWLSGCVAVGSNDDVKSLIRSAISLAYTCQRLGKTEQQCYDGFVEFAGK